jgi:WD40 repeat protein
MGETLAALASQRRTSVAMMTQVPRERGGVAFSADGKMLAWIANSNAVVIVDVDLALTGEAMSRGLISSPVPITSVAFAPCALPLPAWRNKAGLGGQDAVCTAHCNGAVKLWNSRTLELLTTLLSHVADVTGLCFAADSNFNLTIYTVSVDKTLKVLYVVRPAFNQSFNFAFSSRSGIWKMLASTCLAL